MGLKIEKFYVIFLYEHKYLGRVSNLHQCTFKRDLEVSLWYFYVILLLKVGRKVYNGESRCISLGLHAMIYYFNTYCRF